MAGKIEGKEVVPPLVKETFSYIKATRWLLVLSVISLILYATRINSTTNNVYAFTLIILVVIACTTRIMAEIDAVHMQISALALRKGKGKEQ